MKVFIARHGEASFDAPSDFERELTERGERATERLVKEHLEALKEIDVIWCSQLKRAVQTAEVYSQALTLKPLKQTFLSPDSSPQQVIKALEKAETDYQALLLVSHQPLVGDLVSLLTSGNVYTSHPYVTSEVVVLEMDYPGLGTATIVENLLPN